ncbi:MAG: hypothetical protein KIT54_10400 [Phycisphaeraceae bacterium]|nr:hypothetical protein [Phycisphaeraceae bacterium]
MPAYTSNLLLPSRVCGPICGLCGFAVGMISGLLSSGEASGVLVRSLVGMLACYGLGMAIGFMFEMLALRVVERERSGSGQSTPLNPEPNKKISVANR